MAKPVIVIIGASFAGIQVAKELLKSLTGQIKVVLINPSSKWYFNVAAPRILAKPSAFKPEDYLIPIAKGFSQYSKDSFELLIGSATAINTKSKTVAVSSSPSVDVSYDYLVIASGSSTHSLTQGAPVPFKPTGDTTDEMIRKAQKDIQDARSVVIGGAGPIGVEFAGELAEAWQGRSGVSITLVSNSKHPLPGLKESSGIAAEKILAKMNVRVITSRKVVDASNVENGTNHWVVTLDNGEKLNTDLYISSTGVVPNNQFIPAEFLSSDGWVNVDHQFRVKGNGSLPIFAVGDITTQPVRTAMKVSEQIPIVVGNLKAEVLQTRKWVSIKPNQSVMMLVPVGSSTGTGQMMGMKPWGKLVAMIKGKDFFVSKAPQMVGLA